MVNELEEMLSKLKDQELVNELFDSRLNLLIETIPLLNFYRDFLINKKNVLIVNIAFMRDTILPNLKIIAKYSNVSENFENGLWFIELGETKSKDPIVYAINNNTKIENIDPIDWAIENNVKIDGMDAEDWVKNNSDIFKSSQLKEETKDEIKTKSKLCIDGRVEQQAITDDSSDNELAIDSSSLNTTASSIDTSNSVTATNVLINIPQPQQATISQPQNSPISTGGGTSALSSNAALSTLTAQSAIETLYGNNKYILLTVTAISMAVFVTVAYIVYHKHSLNTAKFATKALSEVNQILIR